MIGSSGSCGPDCRYRHMYEGSQQSLSDMASRQAQAVDRLGRVRAGLITTVKRRFPRGVLDAEAALGRRLREIDDEVLLAQVDALIHAGASGSGGRAQLERARQALQTLGVPLSASSADQFVDELEQLASRGVQLVPRTQAPATSGTSASDAGDSLDRDSLAGLFDPPEGVGSGATQPLAAQAARGYVDAVGAVSANTSAGVQDELAVLFGGDDPQPASQNTAVDLTGAVQPGSSTQGSFTHAAVEQRGRPAPPGAPDSPTLRPQPQATKRASGTKAKPIRTQAAPPERTPLPLAAPVDGAPSPSPDDARPITDELSRALLAAVCIPRPVFASDLIAVAGSMDAVRDWEMQCRQDNLPVRIVPAKMRHVARGSLVFPVEDAKTLATEFRRSVWGDVLSAKGASYRGARLYELSVLLHRVGEQVVSHRLGEHTVTFRLAQPGGLTGVVVCFSTDLGEESEARGELVEQLEGLIGERLAGVAVLTTSGEAGVYERVIELLETEGRARRWQPTMPVVAAKSWEYADTRGTSATLVLGG